ncbi:hypothetical protein QT972_13195 [Microcoleus sp. herbarium7]|uniref:hypothetical protein n=1 Tax=unclassified Microcoleus TaxID=2642155 RepID=UPI002FD249AC
MAASLELTRRSAVSVQANPTLNSSFNQGHFHCARSLAIKIGCSLAEKVFCGSEHILDENFSSITRYGRVRRHQQSVTKIKNLAATHPTQTVNRLKQGQTIVFLSAKLGLIAL